MERNSSGKRILSMLLIVAMILTLLPNTGFSENKDIKSVEISNFKINLSEKEIIYVKDSKADELKVLSNSIIGKTIKYQWYSNTKKTTDGAIALNLETSSAFTPSTAKIGTTYYYIVATNKIGTKISKYYSNMAKVTIKKNKENSPCFEVNLNEKEVIYSKDSKANKLKVLLSTKPSEIVTYQWYSNTKKTTDGSIELKLGKSSIFTPLTSEIGTLYYYAVASKTVGDKTFKSYSNIAMITTTVKEKPAPFILLDGNGEECKIKRLKSHGYNYHGNNEMSGGIFYAELNGSFEINCPDMYGISCFTYRAKGQKQFSDSKMILNDMQPYLFKLMHIKRFFKDDIWDNLTKEDDVLYIEFNKNKEDAERKNRKGEIGLIIKILPEKAIDKSKLKALINSIGKNYYKKDDRWNGKITNSRGFYYSVESEVISSKELLENENASQFKIDSQIIKLEKLLKSVLSKKYVNATILYETILEQKKRINFIYEDAVWANLTDAIYNAEVFLKTLYDDNGLPTKINTGLYQSKVIEATDKLLAAVSTLANNVIYSDLLTSKYDRTSMEKMISGKFNPDNMDKNLYNIDSYNKFLNTRKNVVKWLSNAIVPYEKMQSKLSEEYKRQYGDLWNACYKNLIAKDDISVEIHVVDNYALRKKGVDQVNTSGIYKLNLKKGKTNIKDALQMIFKEDDIKCYDTSYVSSVGRMVNGGINIIINGKYEYNGVTTSDYRVSKNYNEYFELIDGDKIIISFTESPMVKEMFSSTDAYIYQVHKDIRYHVIKKDNKVINNIVLQEGESVDLDVVEYNAFLYDDIGREILSDSIKVFVSDVVASKEEAYKAKLKEMTEVTYHKNGKFTSTFYNKGWYRLYTIDTSSNGGIDSGESIIVKVIDSAKPKEIIDAIKRELEKVYTAYDNNYYSKEDLLKMKKSYAAAMKEIKKAKSVGEARIAQKLSIDLIVKIQKKVTEDNKTKISKFREAINCISDDISLLGKSEEYYVEILINTYKSMTLYQRGLLTGNEIKKYNDISNKNDKGLPEISPYNINIEIKADSEEAEAIIKDMIDYFQKNSSLRKLDVYWVEYVLNTVKLTLSRTFFGFNYTDSDLKQVDLITDDLYIYLFNNGVSKDKKTLRVGKVIDKILLYLKEDRPSMESDSKDIKNKISDMIIIIENFRRDIEGTYDTSIFQAQSVKKELQYNIGSKETKWIKFVKNQITSSYPNSEVQFYKNIDSNIFKYLSNSKEINDGIRRFSVANSKWALTDENFELKYINKNWETQGHFTIWIDNNKYEIKEIIYDGIDKKTLVEYDDVAVMPDSDYKALVKGKYIYFGKREFFSMPYNDVNIKVIWGRVDGNGSQKEIEAIKNSFETYSRADFSQENWILLLSEYNKGLAGIKHAKTKKDILKAKDLAISAMKAVPKIVVSEIPKINNNKFDAGDQKGTVDVYIENSTFSGGDFTGNIVTKENYAFGENDSMMTIVLRALAEEGYTWTGSGGSNAECAYDISYLASIRKDKKMLGEFSGDAGSGWMGTLNDWFTNEGFNQFTYENGKVKNKDEIRIQFTQNMGADLGGTWNSADTSLKKLSFSAGILKPKFSSDNKEYALIVYGDKKVKVRPTAINKNYLVKTFLNDKVTTNHEGNSLYKRTESIPIKSGDVLNIGIGENSWPSMNNQSSDAIDYAGTWYKIEVISEDNGALYLIKFIDNIEDVTMYNFETYNELLESARYIYNLLNKSEKNKVTNYSKIDKLEKKIKFFTEIKEVKKLLKTIPISKDVKMSDKLIFVNVSNAYKKLTEDQRLYITIGDVKNYNECLKVLIALGAFNDHKIKAIKGNDKKDKIVISPEIIIKNATATVKLKKYKILDKIKEAKKNKLDEIIIRISLKKNILKVKTIIQKESIGDLIAKRMKLIIKSSLGVIELSNEFLKEIKGNLDLSIEKVNKKSLNEKQRKAIGNENIYNIKAVSNNIELSKFGKNILKISLPYILKDGETGTQVYVWYLNDEGVLEKISSQYDKKTGLATFTTNHLSYYLVNYSKTKLDEVKFYNPYIMGYPNGLFKPRNTISRAEVATIFSKVLHLNVNLSGSKKFDDVSKNDWYFAYVQAATRAGLFKVDKTKLFRPNDPISRGEIAVIFTKYWEFLKVDINDSKVNSIKDITGDDLMDKYIYTMYNMGITKGFLDGTYRPNEPILREQIVVMVNSLIARPMHMPAKSKFNDILTTYWAFGYIEAASEKYVIKEK